MILMILNIKLCVTRFEYEEPKMGPNSWRRRNFDKSASSISEFMIILMWEIYVAISYKSRGNI